MSWIIKVGDQYLEWHKGGSGRCSKKQKDAIRFKTEAKALRVAVRTWGLTDDPDDDCGARVVLLTPFVPKWEDGDPCCKARGPRGYACTRVQGHKGEHRAWGIADLPVIEKWAKVRVSETAPTARDAKDGR